jgi:hypothetical protein
MSNSRTVLRALYRKLKPSARCGRKARENRHLIARLILKEHADARRTFIEWRF